MEQARNDHENAVGEGSTSGALIVDLCFTVSSTQRIDTARMPGV